MVYAPFILTGYFFHQSSIGYLLGWPKLWMASWFGLFALGRVTTSFLTGPLTDKLSAKTLYPYFLVPLGVGVFALLSSESSFACLLLLIGGGITVGASGTVKSALLPEIYGTKSLGAIRSLSGTLMAMSTALSPWLFGILLDKGLGITMIWLSVLGIGISIGLSLVSLKLYSKPYSHS